MTGVAPLVHLPPAADWDAHARANYSSIEWCRRELNLRNDQLLVGSAICSRQTGLLAPDTPRTTTVRPPLHSQLERNSSRSREAEKHARGSIRRIGRSFNCHTQEFVSARFRPLPLNLLKTRPLLRRKLLTVNSLNEISILLVDWQRIETYCMSHPAHDSRRHEPLRPPPPRATDAPRHPAERTR